MGMVRLMATLASIAATMLAANATVLHVADAAHAADAARLRYGRHLAGECAACHGAGGKGTGDMGVRDMGAGATIPALAGRPAGEIIALLADYTEGRKTNPVMVSVARSLDAEQSAAIAAYFASLAPPDAAAAP
jgi:cytochrome c553